MVLFSFIFETWLSAVLVAGVAVSVPIIIHLLNRKRFRVVTWAAMRFLLAAQRKNSRRMRLEQLLLLAVRVLLVLLLVAAMGCVMPWAENWWRILFPESAAFAAMSSARTHKIIVVDGSFSMALKAGERTCFDRAKQQAEQIVQSSPRGDSFSVVLMAAPPRRLVPEPSEDPRKVAAELQNLKLPHGNADLLATLNAVEDLLRQSPGKFQEREVYFLTDLQHSTWIGGASAGPTPGSQLNLNAVLQKIQSRARTIFIDIGHEVGSNLAITHLALGAPLATTATVTPITATIHNYGPDTRDQVRVELLVGKAQTAANDPPFALKVVHQTVVKLGRGQNTVSFPYKFSAPGDHVVQIKLDGDALELDDVRSAVVTVKNAVPVMLVNGKLVEGKPQGKLADEATEWLRLALNPFDNAPGTPGPLPARPKVLTEKEFNDAGAGDLTPYDCVFLCDVKQFTPSEVRRLETHVRRGGGVVFCMGDQVDPGAYNDLLYRNGTGLLPAKLLGKQAAPPNTIFHFATDEKAYQKPPLDAFTDDNDRISLLMPRFRQYVRAEPAPKGARKVLAFQPASANVQGTPGAGKELENLPVGDPALVEWQPLLPPAIREEAARSQEGPPRPMRARGRVLLVTTTVNMDWSTWPAYRSYLPLMQELLSFSLSGKLREQAVTVGEPLEEFLPLTGGGLDVALHTPDDRTEAFKTLAHEDVSLLHWADTDVSGIYRATVGQHPQEHLFAVNVPVATDGQQASESDLTRATPEDLHKTYPDWEFQLVTDSKDVTHTGGPGPTNLELTARPLGTVFARWLLLGVLALLLAEVVLAWCFGHYSSVAGAAGGPPARGRLLPGFAAVFSVVTFLLVSAVLLQAAWTGDFLSFLPEGVRRTAEAWMGIPPPASGEGSRWRLEFTPYLWDAAADPWLAGVLGALGAALVLWIYRQEAPTVGFGYKLLLAGVRACLLLLALSVMLPQLRLWFERQGWPDVAIILDDSQSMGTVDRYRDAHVQAAADQLTQVASLTSQERLALAQALVAGEKNGWLPTLLNQHKVKVHVYHASGRAHRLADVAGPEQIDPAVKAIHDLHADAKNDSSQLGTAVRQVLNDFRGGSLAAVVLLSDGVTTEGEDLVKVSRYAAQVGVPLYLVGLGDSFEQRDLILHDLQCEDSVYTNDRIVFELRLTGQGYTNLTVPVRLREKGSDKILDKQDISVGDSAWHGQPAKVRLIHQPKEPGEKTYVIETPVQPDEVQADNNVLERTVFVRDTKLFKVLYVEGYPRYEYRFIKTLLERESNRTKGNKTIDLKVLLLDADPDYAAEDRSALAEFPIKTELNQFDVVILGDVDPKHPKLGDKNLLQLAEFVREKGGGLLMIAGERSAPYLYKNSALADVLPIEVVRADPPDEPDAPRTQGYRPELTSVGRLHPIFRFNPDEKANEEVWRHLREMYWWAEGYRVKPAAEVLAVHPKVKARADERGARLEDGQPLVCQQFVGAGRCMFFGFGETWRWRYREDELHFNQFWIQTVRYLARSRLGRVELHLDRQTPYRRGEPIKMTVRFPDDAAPPGPETEVKVVVERRPPRKGAAPREDAGKAGPPLEVRTVQLARVEGSRSTYEGLLTQTPEGEYQFWLSAPPVPTGPKPRAECRVLAPPGEMELLRMNLPDLERAAEESHGRFYTLAEADRLLGELPPGTRVSLNASGPPWLLWNHTLLFAVVLLLLTLEWVLRKRKHLL